MQLNRRQKQILSGVLRDRDWWANQVWRGYGLGSQRLRTHDAANGYARLNAVAWLGCDPDRGLTPSQSSMNSRAYAALEKLGLVVRHNFDGYRKTTHLKLTDRGESIARGLVETKSQ